MIAAPVNPNMYALAFNPAGVLYGLQNTSAELHTINQVTGATTLVGPSGLPAQNIGGLACDDAGNFYAAFGTGVGSSSLYRINASTGAATLIGSIGFTGVSDISFTGTPSSQPGGAGEGTFVGSTGPAAAITRPGGEGTFGLGARSLVRRQRLPMLHKPVRTMRAARTFTYSMKPIGKHKTRLRQNRTPESSLSGGVCCRSWHWGCWLFWPRDVVPPVEDHASAARPKECSFAEIRMFRSLAVVLLATIVFLGMFRASPRFRLVSCPTAMLASTPYRLPFVAMIRCSIGCPDSGEGRGTPSVFLHVPKPRHDLVIPITVPTSLPDARTFQIDVDLNHDGWFAGPGRAGLRRGPIRSNQNGERPAARTN